MSESVSKQQAALRCRIAAALLFCAIFPQAHAENPSLPPLTATPSIPFWPHLTDGQDRPGTGHLRPGADTRSRATALYADAVVSQDDPDSDSNDILKELRQVVALDPTQEEARARMANILLRTGRVEDAFTQLQAAFAADPRSVQLEAMLGYTQRLRGENDEALRLSTHALSRDPTQALSMRVLLEIAGDQDDLSGGVIHIEDLLKAGGASVPASAWQTLGRLYVEIAKSEAHPLSSDLMLKTLLPIYRQAVEKAPGDLDGLTLLAQTYQDLGRKEEALKTLRQAVALEPGDIDLLLHCAQIETSLGRNPDAIRDYQEAYRLNPNLNGLREILARLYLDTGKFDAAIRLLEDTLTVQPDDPGVEMDLGIACEGAHHAEAATQWFQRAFTSPLCPVEAFLKLAVFQLADGKVKEAGRTLTAARTRFPDSPMVLFYAAIQNRYAKNYPAALACLDAMRKMAPSSESDILNPDFYAESALTMGLAHRNDLIEPLLREGLLKYPSNPDMMNELAYFWADQGTHLSQALALGLRAAQLAPSDGAIEDTCGWTYFKMGEVNRALPYLQRAAVLTNNDPVVLQHLGDVYLRMGRTREAIATWREALEKDSGNRDLATRIAAALATETHAYQRSPLHP